MLKNVIFWVLDMVQARHWLSVLSCSLLVSVLSIAGNAASAYGVSLVNTITIPGETTDLTPLNGGSGGANVNRFGFFSDLYYDRYNNVYYGLGDRGPGGGVIPYQTRVQKFSLDVNPNTGAISNFTLLETIRFTKDGKSFNGLNPRILNGDAGVLGLSFDPEGFAIAPNGNFYISDEYGPSVYEFRTDGSFVRAFTTPDNLLPRDSNGNINFVTGRQSADNPDGLVSGRQDNRGFEGLTLSPDGSKLFALLQAPLVNEGAPDGRRSRNLRMIEFDTATGESTAQYIYQVESLADINDRIPGTEDDFGANAQGRNIGISAITALNDKEFLVLERDNRGFGVDALNELVEEPTDTPPRVGSKRIYKINLIGATDVSGISLAGINSLPEGINPVSKSLFLDIAKVLSPEGDWTEIGEKIEGLTIGPRLNDGSYELLLGTDNDFSVTQLEGSVQFDICSNDSGTSFSRIPIDSGCPAGQNLIPGYLYSLKVSAAELGNFVTPEKVPEPTAMAGLILFGLSGLWLKRR